MGLKCNIVIPTLLYLCLFLFSWNWLDSYCKLLKKVPFRDDKECDFQESELSKGWSLVWSTYIIKGAVMEEKELK